MPIKDIKDGIVNYLRQISPNDRAARDANLKSTFDFESWITALESSVGDDEAAGQGVSDGQYPTPSASEVAQAREIVFHDDPMDTYSFFSLDGLDSIFSEDRGVGAVLENWGSWPAHGM